MSGRVTITPSARASLGFLFAVLLASSVLGDASEGKYAHPGSWPLYVSSLAGAVGVAAILIPFRPGLAWVRDTLALTAAVVVSTTIMLLYGSPSFDNSLFAFGVMLCAYVAHLGTQLPGLVTGLVLSSFHAVVVYVVDPGAPLGELFELYALIFLLAAYAWSLYARRLGTRENDFRKKAREVLLAQRESERDLARLRMNNALADSGALLTLQHVASSDTVDTDLQLDARVAEASLRDRIRCPGMQHPALSPEIAKARRRGVEILLLAHSNSDESGDMERALSDPLAARLAETVRDLEAGEEVTLRRMNSEFRGAFVSVAIKHPDGSGGIQLLGQDGELARPR